MTGSPGFAMVEEKGGPVRHFPPRPGHLLADSVRTCAKLECMVLHACHTDAIAEACVAHMSHRGGAIDSIRDLTASNVTHAFHQAFLAGRTYDNAFETGPAEGALANDKAAQNYAFRSRGDRRNTA